ncbi:MAG: hypothetical protein NC419_03390 [Muribaculaceae bacterium]|nr:hypothetical protein [Muribaculaceae bacterium]
MKKKKSKSRLDEMQEKKLLEIEHNGFWLAFWGLLAAMSVQLLLYGREHPEMMAGEWIVFMSIAFYTVIACMKNGIWDRKLAPTPGTNLMVSLIAGAVTGILFFAITYRNYQRFLGSVMTGLFMMIQVFVLCFGGLSIAAAIHHKKEERLENEEEDEENHGE